MSVIMWPGFDYNSVHVTKPDSQQCKNCGLVWFVCLSMMSTNTDYYCNYYCRGLGTSTVLLCVLLMWSCMEVWVHIANELWQRLSIYVLTCCPSSQINSVTVHWGCQWTFCLSTADLERICPWRATEEHRKLKTEQHIVACFFNEDESDVMS